MDEEKFYYLFSDQFDGIARIKDPKSILKEDLMFESICQPMIISQTEVLPDNCKFCFPTIFGPLYVIEQKPTIRSIIYESKVFRLSFPYVVFVLYGKSLYVFMTPTRLQSIYDEVYAPILPNVDIEYQVCMRYDEESVEETLDLFWSSSFNKDYSTFISWYFSHTILKTFQDWVYLTKKNPLFILDIKYLHAGRLSDFLPEVGPPKLDLETLASSSAAKDGIIRLNSKVSYNGKHYLVSSIKKTPTRTEVKLEGVGLPVLAEKLEVLDMKPIVIDEVTIGNKTFRVGEIIRFNEHRVKKIESIQIHSNGMIMARASNKAMILLSFDSKNLVPGIYQPGDVVTTISWIDLKPGDLFASSSFTSVVKKFKHFELDDNCRIRFICEDGSVLKSGIKSNVEVLDIEEIIYKSTLLKVGLKNVVGLCYQNHNFIPILDNRVDAGIESLLDGDKLVDNIHDFSVGDKVLNINRNSEEVITGIRYEDGEIIIDTNIQTYLIYKDPGLMTYYECKDLYKVVDEVHVNELTLRTGMKVTIRKGCPVLRLPSLNRATTYEIKYLIPAGFKQNAFSIMILNSGFTMWLSPENIRLFQYQDDEVEILVDRKFPSKQYKGAFYRLESMLGIVLPTTFKTRHVINTNTYYASYIDYQLDRRRR